jgi:hypothetical protein
MHPRSFGGLGLLLKCPEESDYSEAETRHREIRPDPCQRGSIECELCAEAGEARPVLSETNPRVNRCRLARVTSYLFCHPVIVYS